MTGPYPTELPENPLTPLAVGETVNVGDRVTVKYNSFFKGTVINTRAPVAGSRCFSGAGWNEDAHARVGGWIMPSVRLCLNCALVAESRLGNSLRGRVAVGMVLVTMWCWTSCGVADEDACGAVIVKNTSKTKVNPGWSAIGKGMHIWMQCVCKEIVLSYKILFYIKQNDKSWKEVDFEGQVGHVKNYENPRKILS